MASSPVFLPGELHGQRSLAGYSPWGVKQSDTTELLTLGRDQRCPHGALLRPAEARWSMQPVPRAGPAQQTPQKQPALKTVFTRRGSGGQCPLGYWGSSAERVQQGQSGGRGACGKQAKFRSQDRGQA